MQPNSYELHQRLLELGKQYSDLTVEEKRRFHSLTTSGTNDISLGEQFIDENLNRNDNMLLG